MQTSTIEKKVDFEPSIIAFCCNWCSYAGADLAGISKLQYPSNVKIIRVMCTGMVNPIYILKALLDGVDGVLVAGCHPGDCHYLRGNLLARRRITMLKKVIKALGINPQRLKVEWISASEGGKFVQVVKNFTEEIKKLGPNNLKEV